VFRVEECTKASQRSASGTSRRVGMHCKTGSGICDRSLLSQSEKEEVASLELERNLLASQTGDGLCGKSLLTPSHSRQIASAQHPLNFLACKTGEGYCDETLLDSDESKECQAVVVTRLTTHGGSKCPRRCNLVFLVKIGPVR